MTTNPDMATYLEIIDSTAFMAISLLAHLNHVHGNEGSLVRSSTFQLITTAATINQTNVHSTYKNTDSALHCGMRCGNLQTTSFFYVEQASMCYCNNHHDMNIISASGPAVITYGYEAGLVPRQGNSSECQSIYDMGYRGDGVYNLSTGEEVTCDLASFGWIVFQRRLDGSVDFYRNWTEYVDGFGDLNGEFWLGLETIYQFTQTECELSIYLEAGPNATSQDNGFATFTSFSVSDVSTNYTLNVSGFSGNVGDSFSYHSGKQFSTFDVDNDIVDMNCAEAGKSGWWYGGCCSSNLNGMYLAGSHNTTEGIAWSEPWGFKYSLLRTEMAFRC